MQDMAKKCRQVFQRDPNKILRGERRSNAVLTEEQVRDIRRRYGGPVGRGGHQIRGGAKQSALATEYGVSQVVISAIIRRKAWAHV